MPFAKRRLSALQEILLRIRARQQIELRSNTPLTETRVRRPAVIGAYGQPSSWTRERGVSDDMGRRRRGATDDDGWRRQ